MLVTEKGTKNIMVQVSTKDNKRNFYEIFLALFVNVVTSTKHFI